MAGVVYTFNTTTNKHALPLSPGQKFRLEFYGSMAGGDHSFWRA